MFADLFASTLIDATSWGEGVSRKSKKSSIRELET